LSGGPDTVDAAAIGNFAASVTVTATDTLKKHGQQRRG